jgi:uracil-DNA glycosylase family 4
MAKTFNGQGPLDAKLWIVGECPSEECLSSGDCFAGYSGKFFREKLLLVGIDPDSVRYDNLLSWRPPKGNFEAEETSNKNAILDSVEKLCQRIREGKPNLVFCVGAKALQYFHNERDLGKWRGHIFWSDRLGCKMMFSYRADHCVRQFHVEKKQHPGQYAALLQADCLRASEECKVSHLTFPEVKLLTKPSFIEAKGELERLIDEKKIISYDIETLGNCLMDCIGLCNNLTFSTCIPFYIPNHAREIVPYWQSEYERIQIFRLVREILRGSLPKVAQNSQYDNIILHEYYDIIVRNCCHDTMVIAHDLYSSLPKNLGCLIGLYSKLPYHKFMIHSDKTEDRWTYNALDALANLHVMQGEEKEALELEVYNHYYLVSHQAIRPCNDMQWTGTNVDIPRRDEAITRETYIMERILQILDTIFPNKINTDKKYDHKVNPRSGKDKVVVFHQLLKCKVKYDKGAICLDQDVLSEYEESKHHYVQLLAKAFKMYLLSGSMRSKLETELKNGRLHTAYDVTGTDTGRLNSSESVFGGTNVQNLKKGIQRQMLIPN